MEESHLGAEARCQTCFEPFGRLEDLKAPYVIPCGHTFCLSCLNTDDTCCGICGSPFERHIYLKLLALHEKLRNVPSDPCKLAQQLRESIARLNDYTEVYIIRRIYEKARRFVDSQPRHLFKDLETNVCLLGILLQNKEMMRAHSQVTNDLAEKLYKLRSENLELEAKFNELAKQKGCDHVSIMRQLPLMMRRNPDFDLLSDEVLEFRKEINELKSVIQDFRSQHPDLLESPTNARSPSPSNPAIIFHPASRTPSPSPSLYSPINTTRETEGPRFFNFLNNVPNLNHPNSEVSEILNLNLPTTEYSPGITDAPFDSALLERSSDRSSAGGENHASSEITLLSEIPIDDFKKGIHGSDTLLSTGYTPTVPSTIIYQPRAEYPGNTVRFNLDTEENSSEPESDDNFISSTPSTDIDSVMAMSISSLPMLKTPLKEGFRLNEHISPLLKKASLRGARLSDLLIEPNQGGISSVASVSQMPSRQTPLLSSDDSRSGARRQSRVVTRSKSFPNILATRTMSDDISLNTATANSRFMAELRSCLTEIITRVFIQLMENWNGQALNASSTFSSASHATLSHPLSQHLPSSPLQRNQTPS